jgi:hypothetical protein
MPLISTDLISGFLEASQQLSDAEKLLSLNNVQVSYDAEDLQASISASLPIITASTAEGLSIEVRDFAPIAGFDAGTAFEGGATVTNPSKALAIMAEQINRAELALEAAGQTLPDGAGVGLSASFDNAVLTISATLPLTISINAQGQPVMAAVNYLA